MKKILFTLYVIIIGLSVQAQTWFPIDAEWTYQEYSPSAYPFHNSIISIKCTKDTVIEENTASVISGRTSCSSAYFEHIFYHNPTEDIVYIFINGEFKPYFDFSKNAGESYFMYFPNIEHFTHELPYDSLEVKIDSIINETIDGINLRIQHITTNSDYYFFRGPIMEYIGGVDGFYPESATCDMTVFNGLHCYFDETFSYYSNFIFQTEGCGYILQTSIYEQPQKWYIYPNPAKDFIMLEADMKVVKIEIYNLLGKCVLAEECFIDKHIINIQALYSGNYYIKITSITGDILSCKLIKL